MLTEFIQTSAMPTKLVVEDLRAASGIVIELITMS